MQQRFAGAIRSTEWRETPDCAVLSEQPGGTMSQFNGDKARFNRERKRNIQRRKRTKALFQAAGVSAVSADRSKKARRVADLGEDQE